LPKIFSLKFFGAKIRKKKNIMIGGVEKGSNKKFGDFSVLEHIDYTCKYIDRIIEKIVEKGLYSKKVKKYLEHYREISSITYEQLGGEKYAEYVRRVMN